MYTAPIKGSKGGLICSKCDNSDSNILSFFSNFYNIPKSISEKLDSIGIVVDHIYGEIHCTWNKKHEPNNDLTLVHFEGNFTDKEFDSARKTKYFIETWCDEVKGYEPWWCIYYKVPDFFKTFSNVEFIQKFIEKSLDAKNDSSKEIKKELSNMKNELNTLLKDEPCKKSIIDAISKTVKEIS